jgi:succinyl-diaminopimelate desuccinylase
MTASIPALAAEPGLDAAADAASVTELTQQLVRLPSRGGLDPYEPILGCLEDWLAGRGLTPRRLHDQAGHPVALTCDLAGARPGPRFVLDACLDTAPFGDEAAWRHPPTSGMVEDGWLYGRGSSDQKVAVAAFAHLLARLSGHTDRLTGTLTLLADLDEHTGGFAGARRYFEGPAAPNDIAGVFIGYPGLDHVVVGSRGFWRATITVHGTAGHSGGRSTVAGNAVEKAARLVADLTSRPLHNPGDAFTLPPKLTVTALRGGQGFTIVPDRCEVDVDVRLTPSFDAAAAGQLVVAAVAEADHRWPTGQASRVEVAGSWPAYRLPSDSALSTTLRRAAARATGRRVREKVSGPSNIGNYLAGLGIPATAGFGVRYRNLHGTDECIQLASLPPVLVAYQEAALALLSQP